jgi:hypothetical protein
VLPPVKKSSSYQNVHDLEYEDDGRKKKGTGEWVDVYCVENGGYDRDTFLLCSFEFSFVFCCALSAVMCLLLRCCNVTWDKIRWSLYWYCLLLYC